MTQLPNDLALRLEEIFSPQEITQLKSIFRLKARPHSARITYPETQKQTVIDELQLHNIDFEEISFPKNAIIFSKDVNLKNVWNLESYKKGQIYLQGLSSQLPVHFFSTADSKTLRILDACAAPGGKTLQLVEKYPQAEIWAFEPNTIRYKKMVHNFDKFGAINIRSIHDSIENIGNHMNSLEYFDIILIDAPCSGEGSLNYSNEKFLSNWSMAYVKSNYQRQKMICDTTLPYLKVGGEMIYSTCTLAPEENEGVIHYLLCNHNELRLQKLDFKENKYIKTKRALKNFETYSFKKEISEHCIRVIPSEYSEGFFKAKLKKGVK